MHEPCLMNQHPMINKYGAAPRKTNFFRCIPFSCKKQLYLELQNLTRWFVATDMHCFLNWDREKEREREWEWEIACMSGRNEPCLVPGHAVNAMLVRTIAVIICRHIFIVCVALWHHACNSLLTVECTDQMCRFWYHSSKFVLCLQLLDAKISSIIFGLNQ